ncbi:MAG TPA: hypothetical protein VJN70_09010, partial [Gemmatimonadaceae bacterium]|nr:hypothetical protein [Gemmatimonadaceae bacterium]
MTWHRKPTHGADSVGTPLDRVDGRLKVTGGARYAAEYPIPNVAHGVIIASTIAKGRVKAIDTSVADKAPGVIKILTPFNAPRLPGAPVPGPHEQRAESSGQRAGNGGAQGAGAQGTRGGAMRVPTLLQDDVVRYNGQPIGVVVADTFEHAREAVDSVRVTYESERPVLDWNKAPTNPPEDVHPLGGERAVR